VSSRWLGAARSFLENNPDYGVACGRRRERFPDASVYNYLCDIEWNTPVGDADACGGDAMMRAEAFAEVGGFDASLIAGEEPELCIRLRRAGWNIRRLDEEMTLHDAAMTKFSQWWTRAVRAGHAFAEVSSMHASAKDWQRKSVKSAVWAIVLPMVALGLSGMTRGLSLALFGLYPINVARIALRLWQQNEARPWTVATFLMLSKFPEALGWLRFQTGRLTGRRSAIIEYKAP
jgi:GT2 family glycosyltransferase